MRTDSASCPYNWYVIHTNPRQEDRADANLRAWDVEIFNPRIREIRYNQFTDQPFHVVKPLFPRYIFARFNVQESLHKIRFTRGVYSVVQLGEAPSPVDDEIIEVIKSRIGQDGYVRLSDELRPGDSVIVRQDSLGVFEGVFERTMKESERVMILLNTVSYQAHLNVERSMVRKAVV